MELAHTAQQSAQFDTELLALLHNVEVEGRSGQVHVFGTEFGEERTAHLGIFLAQSCTLVAQSFDFAQTLVAQAVGSTACQFGPAQQGMGWLEGFGADGREVIVHVLQGWLGDAHQSVVELAQGVVG